MSMIREMLCKVEEEHQQKLKQLDSIKVQQDSFFSNEQSTTQPNEQSNFSFDIFDAKQIKEESSTIVSDVKKSTNFMSLDEKERAVLQMEQNQRLKNEKPLFEEKCSLSTSVSSQPKDLTTSLINANLNLMAKSTNRPLNEYCLKHPNLFNSVSTTQQSMPKMAALDNLYIPNLSQKPINQSLNSMISNQTNSFIRPSNTLNNSAFPIGSQPVMYNTANSVRSTKQLTKSELDEFLN